MHIANQLLSFLSCGEYVAKKGKVIGNFALEQYLMSPPLLPKV